MEKQKIKAKVLHILPLILIVIVSIVGGYFVGNFISAKTFTGLALNNAEIETLRDNVDVISISGKSPDDFSGEILFQIAEKVLRESTNYEVVGGGDIKTSLGVTQSSATVDRRNGDEFYLAFTTYSSMIKTSRQCTYNLGGDIKMQEGTPLDRTTTNVDWSDKYQEYTWDEYYQTFGKYANVNCCYIVSTKTISTLSPVEKDGDLYKCSFELNPKLGSLAYVKQIGANMGVDSTKIIFNKIVVTFWLDKNFKFVKQEKFESYTVPYYGINLTLDATIETNFSIQ